MICANIRETIYDQYGFFFWEGGIKISITVLNEILFQKMSILQLIEHVRKDLHIVCVPVGRDPDMVLVDFF